MCPTDDVQQARRRILSVKPPAHRSAVTRSMQGEDTFGLFGWPSPPPPPLPRFNFAELVRRKDLRRTLPNNCLLVIP